MIEIKKNSSNSYSFYLKSISGNTLLNSIDFSSEESLMEIVGKLNPLMEEQGVFERRTDHNGHFLFNLKDTEGNLIGQSTAYSSEAGMENGIKNLKKQLASFSGSSDT